MHERPRFPSRALLSWLAICAHIIAVGALLGLFKSLASKLGIVGADLAGIFVIGAVFLGRLYEWNRWRRGLAVERGRRNGLEPREGRGRQEDQFRWPRAEEVA